MNPTDTKTPRMTASEARILRLIATRPGLIVSPGTFDDTRVVLTDSNDGLWESRTADSVLQRLAARGLFPSATTGEIARRRGVDISSASAIELAVVVPDAAAFNRK
jgi:hypothetical protein